MQPQGAGRTSLDSVLCDKSSTAWCEEVWSKYFPFGRLSGERCVDLKAQLEALDMCNSGIQG